MRAIEYTSKVSTNILHLLYSTFTNDLVINSKQACIIEDFLFAFCIEFNRLYIADSILIKKLKKHLVEKTNMHLNACMRLYKSNFVETKNTVLEFFNSDNSFFRFDKIAIFEKNTSEVCSVSKFFNLFFSNSNGYLMLIPVYKSNS